MRSQNWCLLCVLFVFLLSHTNWFSFFKEFIDNVHIVYVHLSTPLIVLVVQHTSSRYFTDRFEISSQWLNDDLHADKLVLFWIGWLTEKFYERNVPWRRSYPHPPLSVFSWWALLKAWLPTYLSGRGRWSWCCYCWLWFLPPCIAICPEYSSIWQHQLLLWFKNAYLQIM